MAKSSRPCCIAVLVVGLVCPLSILQSQPTLGVFYDIQRGWNFMEDESASGAFNHRPRQANLGTVSPRSPSQSKTVESELTLPEDPQTTFCVTWNVNSDHWWTHHPEWFVAQENETHYCFSKRTHEEALYLRELYNIQFHSNCTQVKTRLLRSQGWGSDLKFAMDALHRAYTNKRPVQLYSRRKWHYAPDTCEAKNLNCYFLPLGNCHPTKPRNPDVEAIWVFANTPERYYMEYLTRPQTWLRRAVWEYTRNITVRTPCAVLHVRRGDVVLDQRAARRYHPIEEYVSALDQLTNASNILLLTDDANAIGEATTKFPDKHWMYLDRPRFKGPEGGFENQFPSGDPQQEVIALMSTFQLVRKCHALVHANGHLSSYIHGQMRVAREDVAVYDLYKDKAIHEIYSSSHMTTVNVSRNYMEEDTVQSH